MEVETDTANGTQESSRRRSGRTIRKPDIFDETDFAGSILSNGSSKRKRPVNGSGPGADNEDESDAQSEEDSEGEPDEEEVREKRRTQRKKSTTTKPAAKRAKTNNGGGTTLAIRSANIQSKASKGNKTQKARARPSQVDKDGLFAEVFGRSQTAEDAANFWVSSVKADSVAAIRDLINFVFQCIGCELEITSPDIEDIDNVPTKLGDIVEEYAKDKDAEYPLISKARQYAEFKTVLVDFFSAIIKAMHHNGELYEQPEVYENIHVWIGTMSGANYRPFRHTATTISLAMTSALCGIAGEIQTSMATTKTQLDTENKKKSKNKSRLSGIQESMKADEKKLEAIDLHLRDAFDTVYVHRYRDVDEKIRVECVASLGHWIITYRKMFLEGQYLRYLGWVMSDPNAPTRHEVIKQLKALFKHQRNIPALRAFTDRFRPRMVEMGARDADVSVRVEAIELLDRLRSAELLEPADIETIGRLIFDAEPRVRKAVAKFFVANIEDVYTSIVEDFDKEQYSDALPEEAEDFMSPQQSWIKFKCLADVLGRSDKDSISEHGDDDRRVYRPNDTDTRYMLATQVIFPHMPELTGWEALAGYLLYDHSSIASAPADDTDVGLLAQEAYKLVSGEETVLLDVLYFSARMYLQSIVESAQSKKGGGGRSTNASKDEVRKKQETAAHNLSTIIPQLLSRYGSTPQAATAILRLEQLLDADLVNELAGDGAYEALLDDVNRQFVTHSDRKVLAEASKALRTARGFEVGKEGVDAKVEQIWMDTRELLMGLLKGKNVETRGTLERSVLAEVLVACVRLSNLASVSDCSAVLEGRVGGGGGRKGKGKERAGTALHETLLALLMDTVRRGVPDEETARDIQDSEDGVCNAVVTTLSFYFRWKVVGLKTAIEKNNAAGLNADLLVGLVSQRTNFIDAITPVIEARLPLDPVRITAILNTLDLFTLFATTKHMQPAKGELDEDIVANMATLAIQVPEELMKEIMLTHEKMEKSLARKTKKKIILPSEEDKRNAKKGKKDREPREETQEEIEKPPEDSDDEKAGGGGSDDDGMEDDEEGDDGEDIVEGMGKEKKRQQALLAEQGLCELTSKIVLALLGGVVGGRERVVERLRVNRGKLGKSYGMVVGYLDEKKEKGKGRGKPGPVTPVKGQKVKNVVKGVEAMEIDDDLIEDEEAEEEERRRRRELEDDVVEDEFAEGGVNGEVGEVDGDDVDADDEIMGD